METNLKVDGATHQQVWRHTYGQPRGFDARFVLQILCQNLNIVPTSQLCSPISWVKPALRYIHDECYGVALDAEGNYLIIGGWAAFVSPFVWKIRLKAKVKNNWMKLVLGPNFASSTFFHTLVSGLGMSTSMRRRTLMGGAATPGWEIYLTSCHPAFCWERLSKMHLFFIDFQVSFFLLTSRSHTSWSSRQVGRPFSAGSLVTKKAITLVCEDKSDE